MGPIAILRERGLSPKKGFGQNFLLDPNLCRRIAEGATTPEGGTVLEIGPGLGALTRAILERASRVVAVDRDRDMIAFLEEDLAGPIESGKLTLLTADGLAIDWPALFADGPRPHVVAGNLPYLVTGRFLELATVHAAKIDRALFMVQLEVAERMLAAPSTKAYGALTVFVRAQFDVTRLLIARAGAFHPRPEVDSAVVVLSPRALRVPETDTFRALVRGAFGMRRKTLRNAWKGVLDLPPEAFDAAAQTCNIDLGRRGETLSVAEFAAMSDRVTLVMAEQDGQAEKKP